MGRKEDLLKVFENVDEGRKKIVEPLIEEAVFLEEQMKMLKAYPFIKFHPHNPNLQKVTAAGKQYREFLQTYTNVISKLSSIYGREEGEEESPLRVFLKGLEMR